MATLLDPAGPAAQSPAIALLIDADNVSHAKIGPILGELAKYGTNNVRPAGGQPPIADKRNLDRAKTPQP